MVSRNSLILVLVGLAASAPLANAAETAFTFGGYVKMDVLATSYNDGRPDSGSPIREFHLPGSIPVGGDQTSELDFHARESRFNFATLTTFSGGQELKTFLEMDFLLSPGGNERVSNSFNPRLRHIFFTYQKWLFGQTWSTMQIIVLPDDVDFIGVPDGTIFIRQPQVRYSWKTWKVALENPSSTVLPHQGGDRVVQSSGGLPDLVLRYDHTGAWGFVAGAGILRQLRHVEDSATTSTAGLGLSLGGKVLLGEHDNLRFMLSGGKGLGRYIGLNFATGGVLDQNGDLEAIGSVGGFVALLHHWSKQLRSSFNIALLRVNNDAALTGAAANRNAASYSGNLLYSPVPDITFGVELMHAIRGLESDSSGSFTRLQFAAKYKFGFSAVPIKTGN